jgi:hypothetical protein
MLKRQLDLNRNQRLNENKDYNKVDILILTLVYYKYHAYKTKTRLE